MTIALTFRHARPAFSAVLFALTALAPFTVQGEVQTSADAFTRYELLAPDSHSFRIYYDVSASAPGATRYYNPIRRGSEPEVHGVIDRMTGKALEWKIVDGADARASGLIPGAEDGDQYIRVELARPVPDEGRGRLLIDKTYEDAASYFTDGEELHFKRVLGIKRNAVVLPAGYELAAVNYPSQVITRDDGRIELSFMNPGPAGVPLELVARPLPTPAKSEEVDPGDAGQAQVSTRRPMARRDFATPQRASQTRDIVYFLQQPETHSFRLYHDYEETRPGMDRYLNIVRPGSKASDPEARVLDTGEALEVEILQGSAISDRGIDIGEAVTDSTELVVIWFDPVPEGGSRLLRITETYTDPNRFFLTGSEFLWDRSFGRARNTVVLPEGWYLSENAVPAVVRTRDDGRVELVYRNERPGEIDVLIRGRRRAKD
ncbi:MAG: hypothetical protein V2I82_15940 [Halieaceae bacterium]|jgi:hypothetical protein|nr:hypothetical protein [Halieaceae bacterium]